MRRMTGKTVPQKRYWGQNAPIKEIQDKTRISVPLQIVIRIHPTFGADNRAGSRPKEYLISAPTRPRSFSAIRIFQYRTQKTIFPSSGPRNSLVRSGRLWRTYRTLSVANKVEHFLVILDFLKNEIHFQIAI